MHYKNWSMHDAGVQKKVKRKTKSEGIINFESDTLRQHLSAYSHWRMGNQTSHAL